MAIIGDKAQMIDLFGLGGKKNLGYLLLLSLFISSLLIAPISADNSINNGQNHKVPTQQIAQIQPPNFSSNGQNPEAANRQIAQKSSNSGQDSAIGPLPENFFPEKTEDIMKKHRLEKPTVNKEQYFHFRRPWPGYSQMEAEKGFKRIDIVEKEDEAFNWSVYLRGEQRRTLEKKWGPCEEQSSNAWELLGRISCDLAFGPKAMVFLEGQGTLSAHKDGAFMAHDNELVFRQAYLDFGRERLKTKVGWQILRWGLDKEFAPMNCLNPEDFSQFITKSRGERKKAVPGISLMMDWEERKMELFFAPVFTGHTLSKKSDIWYSPAQKFLEEARQNPKITVDDREPPLNSAAHGTFGAKLTTQTGRTKLESFVISGPDPQISMTSWAYAQDEQGLYPTKIRTFHPFRTLVGGRADLAFSSININLEGAMIFGGKYQRKIDSIFEALSPEDGLESADASSIIFGFSRQLNQLLSVDLHYFHEEKYTKKPLAVPRFDNGLILEMGGLLYHERLNWSFQGIKKTKENGYFSNGELRWKANQNLIIGTGYHLFGGKGDESYFGAFRDNDQIYGFMESSF